MSVAALGRGARTLLDLLKSTSFELQVHKLSAIKPLLAKRGTKIAKTVTDAAGKTVPGMRLGKKGGLSGLLVNIEGRKTPVFVSMKDLKKEVPALQRHFQRSGRRFRTGTDAEDLAFKGRAGILGTAGGKLLDSFRRSPVSTVASSALIGSIGYDIAGGPLAGAAQQSLTGENFFRPERGFQVALEQQKAFNQQIAQRKAEVLQLQRLMSQNMARLASASPHLYNQVMAGRQLPEGAVVIGGQPRQDLMEMLAYDMATGGLAQTKSPEQQMLAAMAQ